MKKRFLFCTLPVIGALSLSACLTERQKPHEIFVDGQFPEKLRQIANPEPLGSHKADEENLVVAVIDNGTDYNHEDLRDRIAYDYEDGRITGAGIDIFGDDNWAAPTLVRGDFYAITARSISDGRIEAGEMTPEEFLEGINKKFADVFFKALKKDSRFQNSLYEKLSPNNFSIYGALNIRSMLQGWLKAKSEKRPKLGAQKPRNNEPFYEHGLSSIALNVVYRSEWKMTARGTPSVFPEILPFLKNNRAFMKFLLKHIDLALELEYNGLTLIQSIDQYADYDAAQKGFKSLDNILLAAPDYATAHYFLTRPDSYSEQNPLKTFVQYICSSLTDTQLNSLKAMSQEEGVKWLSEKFAPYNERIKKVIEYRIDSEAVTPNQKAHARRYQRRWPQLSQSLSATFSDQWESFKTCQVKYNNQAHKKRALDILNGRYNPFAGGGHDTVSHGTHVAGIVAAQHPDISIFPVRVMTSSLKANPDSDKKMKEKHLQEFFHWLNLPPIQSWIAERFVKNGWMGEYNKEAFFDLYKEYVERNFSNQTITYYFVDELSQAIKEVGQRGLKVANISLGDKLEDTPNSGELLQEDQIDETFRYIEFEFFKNKIAQMAHTHARDTLFVVAAGNGNDWIDGDSRSGLPCDISSPGFAPHDPNKELIQNKVENILCVGSIKEDEKLSSFMTLPIDRELPFVLSFGESVYSTVKTSDCRGAKQKNYQKFGDPPVMGFFEPDEEFIEMLKSFDYKAEDLKDEKKVAQIFYRDFSMLEAYIAYGHRTLEFTTCMDQPARARMTGTSMASPAVAGYIAQWILESPSRRHLSPKELIEQSLKRLPRLGGNTRFSDTPKVISIKDLEGRDHRESFILKP